MKTLASLKQGMISIIEYLLMCAIITPFTVFILFVMIVGYLRA